MQKQDKMLLLDTSAIIEILKGTEKGKKILEDSLDNAVFTTVFSIYEVLLGARKEELEEINAFFEDLEVLEFDPNSAIESSCIEKHLTSTGKLVNKIDIFIAAICKVNSATLVTRDKDFVRIPEIKTELID